MKTTVFNTAGSLEKGCRCVRSTCQYSNTCRRSPKDSRSREDQKRTTEGPAFAKHQRDEVLQWFILWPHYKKALDQIPSGSFLRGVRMLSLCMGGFWSLDRNPTFRKNILPLENIFNCQRQNSTFGDEISDFERNRF